MKLILKEGSPAQVIILKDGLLSDDQITQSLKVSEQTMWWRAVVQLADQLRNEHLDAAKGWSAVNNPMGMARDVGAHEALTELLSELEKRRTAKD